jgi:hypothetical protein
MLKNFIAVSAIFESYRDRDDDRHAHLSKAEKWLSKYTLESIDKWPSSDVLEELLDDYPFEGGTIYRGMNFHDEEQYKKFLEETDSGKNLETGSISSWTRTPGQARQFALTRPTYFLNRELMQAEDQKSKNRDFMIGHAGVILQMKIGANEGIDVNKSEHGKEDEVILLPGVHRISIYKTFMPFVKSIKADNVKAEFMSLKDIKDGESEGDTDAAKFQHIMFRFKDGFDEEMRAHLWKLIGGELKQVKWKVELRDVYDYDRYDVKKSAKELYVGWNLPGTFFLYYELLLPDARRKVDTMVNGIIKKIDAEFEKVVQKLNWKEDKVSTQVDRGLQYAAKHGHINPEFIKKIHQGAALRYHEINSLKTVREINKLSGREQEEAMKKFTKDLLATLKNLTSDV